MRTFGLTSEAFAGIVLISYDERGYLAVLDLSGATLTEPQHRAIITRVPPYDVLQIKNVVTGTKGKLIEVREEVSFESFWKKWLKFWGSDNAGGRIPAERAWKKLMSGEQVEAIAQVQKYSQTIKPGCYNCDGSTYLNQKRWL